MVRIYLLSCVSMPALALGISYLNSERHLPFSYKHNLNLGFNPSITQASPSLSMILTAPESLSVYSGSCCNRVQSLSASSSSSKTSRERMVSGVTFEGMRLVCDAIIDSHSDGFRKDEMMCTKWWAFSGLKLREWSIG